MATIVRYVNRGSTAGGDGTTNNTSGATRAFATMSAAEAALPASTGTDIYQIRFSLGGGTADTTAVTFGGVTTSSTAYVEVLPNTSGDHHAGVYSSSYYRLEPTDAVVTCTLAFARFQGLLMKCMYAAASARNVVAASAAAAPSDLRFDRCIAWRGAAATGRVDGFANTASGATNKVSFANCIAIDCNTTALGSGFSSNSSSTLVQTYNCLAHTCTRGYVSAGTGFTTKNSAARSCTDGFNGSFNAASDYNASDLAGDAPGANARNSVTPTFTNEASDDFTLASGDTAYKDFGTNLSADATYPVSVDITNTTRAGTWDIGPSEYVAAGGGFVVAWAARSTITLQPMVAA